MLVHPGRHHFLQSESSNLGTRPRCVDAQCRSSVEAVR